jgi:hypothetical protein
MVQRDARGKEKEVRQQRRQAVKMCAAQRENAIKTAHANAESLKVLFMHARDATKVQTKPRRQKIQPRSARQNVQKKRAYVLANIATMILFVADGLIRPVSVI